MLSKNMRYKMLGVLMLVAVVLLSACQPQSKIQTAAMPVGRAYAEGKEIYFTHTEVSDGDIAVVLTDMMKSPVFHVPSLAQVPDSALANVYVFDNPPGTDGYTPLRRLNVVSWVDPANVRELKSAADVLAAEIAGEVTILQPGVVINMPFVVWDGGKR